MPADPVTSSALAPPALIGKLPGHGDFVVRGASRMVSDLLDTWMSEWLALARESCGEDFREAYEASPPWLWESSTCTAILLPSLDSVGRQFPLLVVGEPDRATQDLYDRAVEAIAQGMTADDLLAEIGGSSRASRVPHAEGWFLPEGAEALLPAPDATATWQEVERWLR